LRLRLTLWFAFGVAVVVAAGAVGIYFMFSQQLHDDVDARLRQEIYNYQGAVSAAVGETDLVEATREYLQGSGANSLRRSGLVLSLRTSGGTIVSSSDIVRPEELPASTDLLESGGRFLGEAQMGGDPYRVAGTSIYLGSEVVGSVLVAESLEQTQLSLNRLLLLLVFGGVFGTVLLGFGSWFLLGWALDPVRRITRTAAAITRQDLSKRIGYKGPNDEIGELAGTMDAMLDRLESAFTAQERFISDVSHELRTPLTIIKGHLQVLDREASPSRGLVRQEHTLVIDELDRMNRLVADLLTLARATRVDFLRKEEVGLDLFLTSLASQGPHLGDREWKVDGLPGGTVGADQDRLTQIFLNLMQNAVSHTISGQTVALGGSRDTVAGTVSLWVRDEGEGMQEEVRQHVFERFYRGEGDAAGGRVGLGLAIVSALVGAHDGRIEVDSSPGQGARFTVTLPA
jgi:two-component system OmpR family sensor kinase